MAQAGFTPISLYYSTTASAQPTGGNLVAGELALNTVDEKLYFKNSAGTVKLLASSASTTNVQTISFGTTGLTPSTATSGVVTVAGTLAVGNGGTGITSFGTGVAGALGQNVSGTGSIALTTSPVFTTPNLGTPSAGTLTSCTGLPLTTGITGTLAIGNGGTGQTTALAAFDALSPMTTLGDMIYEGAGPSALRLPIGSSSQVLTVVGGIPAWATPTGGVTTISFGSTGLTPSTATSGAVSVAGTLAIANGGTGSTSTAYASLTANVSGVLPIANGGTNSSSTTYCNLASNVTGTLPVANGGTGVASTTAYAVLCGGTTTTGPFQAIASVGTSGQVLTSNGAGALPTFQTAGGAAFPSGTVMLFAQTSAPTGWTKNTTTGDNSALRVVTGTASTGGSQGFTTAFASQTPTGSVSITTVSGSAGATTLTTPQIPSHAHKVFNSSPGNPGTPAASSYRMFNTFTNNGEGLGFGGGPYNDRAGTDNTGGGGSHTHPFSFSSGSGTFTGNAINLAVQYIDVIRATAN